MRLGEPFKYSMPSERNDLMKVIDTLLIATCKPVYIQLLSESDMKSLKQNSTFHDLLGIFRDSGTHSFLSYKSMRNHYLGVAGLADGFQFRKGRESQFVKNWEDITKDMKKHATACYKSWRVVSKKGAKEALTTLVGDMINAGVNTKKFQDMLEMWENERMEYFGFE